MPAVPPAADADPDPDGTPAGEVSFSLGDLLVARRRRLAVTPAIVAIDAALFAAMVAASGRVVFPLPTLVRWGGLAPAAVVDGEWWRLLTSMWLHAHPLHLILNLVFLWQLGSIVERMLGPFVFLVVYVLAGVLATAVSLQTLGLYGVSVGASGAIFGLVGVLLAVVVASRRIPGLGRLLADLRTRLIGVTLANLVAGFIIPGIDNGAHVGGLIAGLLLGWLVGRDAVLTTPPPRRTLLPIALTAALAATSVVVATRRAGGPDIAAEQQRFEAVNTPAEASFRAAVADVRAGRRAGPEAADAIGRVVFPPIHAAQARSDRLLRDTQARFRAAAARTGSTAPPDPREGPRGRAFHDAFEWAGFLARYDEAWRVRLLGLHNGDAARIADGDARAARAVRFFSARWTRPEQRESPP
jgi:membrane associated rhomboid family serine protease